MIGSLVGRAVGPSCLIFAWLVLPASWVRATDGGSSTVVIDFDQVPSGNVPRASWTVDDYRFASASLYTITNPPGGSLPLVDNGTPYLANLGGANGGPLTLSRLDALPFTLIELNAAEAFLSDVESTLAGFPNAVRIDLVGNLVSGGSAQTTFMLDGTKDGAGGSDDFQTFELGNEFANLLSLIFHGRSSDGSPGAFAIDNLRFGTPIPEPSSLALCLSTIFVFGVARRSQHLRTRGK